MSKSAFLTVKVGRYKGEVGTHCMCALRGSVQSIKPLQFEQKNDMSGEDFVLVFISVNNSNCHGPDYSPSSKIQPPNSTGDMGGARDRGRRGVAFWHRISNELVYFYLCRRSPL